MEERDDFLTLTDEEGNEVDFVVIDGLELNGKQYLMLIEADAAEDGETEALILRVEADGDDDILVTVDDEEEFNAVAAEFAKLGDDEDSEYDVETDTE